MSDPAVVARAVARYAGRLRAENGLAEASVLSPAGLWLLLAAVAGSAEAAGPQERERLAAALGLMPEDAVAAAAALLADPHPAVGAALGGWLRADLSLTHPIDGPVRVVPLPGQAELDRWAAEHTRGLIARFPIDVDPRTLLVLASALVLQPRWIHPLPTDPDGLLRVEHGVRAVVATESAGPVAVVVPGSADGVDVVSVIAAPGVPAVDVWRAVDEVVDRLAGGELADGDRPAGAFGDGHAWTVVEQIETFAGLGAPADGAEVWRGRVPAWSADARHDLTGAAGVAEVAAGLAVLLPEDEIEVQCVQAATAAYDADGFSAAAVTAMGFRAAGMPSYVERRVRRVVATFDRPHALVALARGGAWDGVPLFHSWVTPRQAGRDQRQ